MILSVEHDILVTGSDLATCEQRVLLFFEKSQLVHYDSITVDGAASMNATDSRFARLLEQGIAGNRRTLEDLLDKLVQEGCRDIEDIITLPQGFQSKMLHTICHLLDGFFGIDTHFYDIDEMSHWITDTRQQQVEESPALCWLLKVRAQSVYGQGFEKKSD